MCRGCDGWWTTGRVLMQSAASSPSHPWAQSEAQYRAGRDSFRADRVTSDARGVRNSDDGSDGGLVNGGGATSNLELSTICLQRFEKSNRMRLLIARR